tara:strand:- start:1801 stop:1968 length:168 start_codon:yes stop_codon:yes gene_type:complete
MVEIVSHFHLEDLMWDLTTLKKLNEQREKLLKEQRLLKEEKGKVIPLKERSKQPA